jgi:hypothetical protein
MQVCLKNSTIANNRATENGVGISLTNGTADITSTIIGNNTAGIAGNDIFHNPGATLNVDHSLLESDDGGHTIPDSRISGDGRGNIVVEDPLLAGLLG